MKIKEVIVVEGKNDSNVLKSYFDCDTIITNGTHLGRQVLQMIAQAKEKRGIIIFTDPDAPGEKIRHAINTAIPGCKNAFIDKKKAHTMKKVGVEHAEKHDLLEALQHVMTYQDIPETLNRDEFMELGLNGQPDSAAKREALGSYLHIGKPNAKTLLKRLNMLQLSKQEVENMIKENT